MLVKLDTLNQNTKKNSTKQHAIVVGAGFGGLAAAMRLGAKGYAVTVFDKLDVVKAEVLVLEDGHRFDQGLTIITMPHLLEELWELAVDLLSMHSTEEPILYYYLSGWTRFMRNKMRKLCERS